MIKLDGGMIADLYAKTYQDIKKLPKFGIVPHNIKTLNKYKVGDSLGYSVRGGLGLMLGAGAEVGYSKLGAGVSGNVGIIAEGTWMCNVKKTGPFTVQARYVKRKLMRIITMQI